MAWIWPGLNWTWDWFGLNWTDLILNIILFSVVPGLTGALGGHLAADALQDTKRAPRIKLIFWAMFVVWVMGTIWQQFRIAQVDLARDTRSTWADAMALRSFAPNTTPPVYAYKTTSQFALFHPPLARIKFSFFSPTAPQNQEPTDISVTQNNDGLFHTNLLIANASTRVAAEKLEVWIDICEPCEFAMEIPRFSRLPGLPEHERYRSIWLLNPGTVLTPIPISLRLRNAKLPVKVGLALKYSCKACDPEGSQEQTIQFLALPPPS
ncbi:MAG: hypothetical protein WAM04_15170 [Candidatus Sulfotelmatobacter sp.]